MIFIFMIFISSFCHDIPSFVMIFIFMICVLLSCGIEPWNRATWSHSCLQSLLSVINKITLVCNRGAILVCNRATTCRQPGACVAPYGPASPAAYRATPGYPHQRGYPPPTAPRRDPTSLASRRGPVLATWIARPRGGRALATRASPSRQRPAGTGPGQRGLSCVIPGPGHARCRHVTHGRHGLAQAACAEPAAARGLMEGPGPGRSQSSLRGGGSASRRGCI